MDLSPAYNWCDSRCDRCPLSDECTISLRLRGRRWAHEMRGEDADDPAVVAADLINDLKTGLRLLEEAAREEGFSLDDLAGGSRSLQGRRLTRAADECVAAVAALVQAMGSRGESAHRAISAVSIAASKTHRLSLHAQSRTDDAWLFDGAPNLLLALRSLTDLDRALSELPMTPERERCQRAQAELMRWLGPWLDEIPEWWSESMYALIAEGRAPSPFCVRT